MVIYIIPKCSLHQSLCIPDHKSTNQSKVKSLMLDLINLNLHTYLLVHYLVIYYFFLIQRKIEFLLTGLVRYANVILLHIVIFRLLEISCDFSVDLFIQKPGKLIGLLAAHNQYPGYAL